MLTDVLSTAAEQEEVKGEKSKKDKKAKVDYSKSPIEFAMDDPELAGLKPDHRRVIAEQMYVPFYL